MVVTKGCWVGELRDMGQQVQHCCKVENFTEIQLMYSTIMLIDNSVLYT